MGPLEQISLPFNQEPQRKCVISGSLPPSKADQPDDADAKATVTSLAPSMGFAVTDAGPLKNARYLEPVAGLNIYLGYGAGLGTAMAPAWIHKA